MNLNETHDPGLTSWVDSANLEGADFPIQNLPFAVFRVRVSDEAFRGGVAIGDQVLDLARLAEARTFDSEINELLQLCAGPSLNAFMGRGTEASSALRLALSRALREGSDLQEQLQPCLVAQGLVEYTLPCHIGDYTDFYTSVNHATNVGKLFRPDNPLLPNYKWVPIGYHGRASSIGVSGQEIPRPLGQTMAPDADSPSFGPCQRLDYETEVGIYIGAGNALGERIGVSFEKFRLDGFAVDSHQRGFAALSRRMVARRGRPAAARLPRIGCEPPPGRARPEIADLFTKRKNACRWRSTASAG
jgi:fumarylacetoacetase